MSASHFVEETGKLGEILLPVHKFTAGVPSTRDYSCLQLHLLRLIRINSHYTRVVLFSVPRRLEGAVEFTTLQCRKLGLKQVKRRGGPFPLHVGSDAQDGYLLKLGVTGLHNS